MKTDCCPSCGAKLRQYRFSLNRGLVDALRKIAEKWPGAASKAELGLTHSQYTNVQKLRYWALAEPISQTHEQRHKGGTWRVTPVGIEFLRGAHRVRRFAVTLRGRVVAFDGELISAAQAEEGWRHRADYAAGAKIC